MSPKTILAEALEIAQRAVFLDSENKVPEALRAYCDACDLLSKVLGHNNVDDDRKKLTQIYETYIDRIRLLTALHPRSSSGSHHSGSTAFTDNASQRSSLRKQSQAEANIDEFIESIERELQGEPPTPTRLRNGVGLQDSTASVLIYRSQLADGAKSQGYAGQESSIGPMSNSSSRTSTLSGAFRHAIIARPNTKPRLRADSIGQTMPAQMSNGVIKPGEADDAVTRKSSYGRGERSVGRRRPSLNMLDLSAARSNGRAGENYSYDHSSVMSVTPVSTGHQPSVHHEYTDAQHLAWPSPQPSELLARPYWAMRLLQGSFAHTAVKSAGVQISQKLFIPRDIWRTPSTKIKGEEEKIEAFQMLVRELQELGQLDRDDLHSLLRHLSNLEKTIDTAQSILSKKLGADSIASSNIPIRTSSTTPSRRNATKTFAKFLKQTTLIADKQDTSSHLVTEFEGYHLQYQRTTSRLFEMAQLIDQINEHLDTESLPIKEQVRLDQIYCRAADFFGRVIVKLYLGDVSQLLCARISSKLS